jgi:hypothetical protein
MIAALQTLPFIAIIFVRNTGLFSFRQARSRLNPSISSYLSSAFTHTTGDSCPYFCIDFIMTASARGFTIRYFPYLSPIPDTAISSIVMLSSIVDKVSFTGFRRPYDLEIDSGSSWSIYPVLSKCFALFTS